MSGLSEQADSHQSASDSEGLSVSCPSCGTQLSRIYADGFLGCEECYKVFNEVVRQALAAMHQTSRHTGKTL